ncbi:MAG: hypothetical protein ACI9TH_001881 [Kiritimatiellia bacterium]|jgi:hypothetical protein
MFPLIAIGIAYLVFLFLRMIHASHVDTQLMRKYMDD